MKLQDSADGSSHAGVDVAFAQQTARGGRLPREVHVKVGRPWVRAVSTVAGTSPSFDGVGARAGHWTGHPTTPAGT